VSASSQVKSARFCAAIKIPPTGSFIPFLSQEELLKLNKNFNVAFSSSVIPSSRIPFKLS